MTNPFEGFMHLFRGAPKNPAEQAPLAPPPPAGVAPFGVEDPSGVMTEMMNKSVAETQQNMATAATTSVTPDPSADGPMPVATPEQPAAAVPTPEPVAK